MNSTICNYFSCYDSIDSLSSRLTDFGNFFILPILNTYSFFTNLICIIVFLNKKLNGETNQILLLISFSDFINVIFRVLLMPARCGIYCSIGYSYLMKFYELNIFLLLGNILLTFVIFLYIYLAIIKLLSFSKKKRISTFSIRKSKLKICLALLVSTIVNSPNYLFTRNISLIGYLNIRNSTNNVIDLRPLYRVRSAIDPISILDELLFVLTFTKGFLMVIILLIINLTAYIKLKFYLKRKISREKKSSMYKLKILFDFVFNFYNLSKHC
jgi:hypothetical protein